VRLCGLYERPAVAALAGLLTLNVPMTQEIKLRLNLLKPHPE